MTFCIIIMNPRIIHQQKLVKLIMIDVFLGGLEQRFELWIRPFFNNILAKVLYIFTFSKLQHLGYLRFVCSVFFFLNKSGPV